MREMITQELPRLRENLNQQNLLLTKVESGNYAGQGSQNMMNWQNNQNFRQDAQQGYEYASAAPVNTIKKPAFNRYSVQALSARPTVQHDGRIQVMI
jgi:flagellar hook-length control protein FliK